MTIFLKTAIISGLVKPRCTAKPVFCVHLCTHPGVCLCLCMYIRRYVNVGIHLYVDVNGYIDVCVDLYMSGCVCIYTYMCVCIYIYMLTPPPG